MRVGAKEGLGASPIAIVGVSALFANARNVHEFWANIVRGRDCIADVPETHWRIEDYYDPDPATPDKTYARRGGFIPSVDFNPLEFGMPPSTLEVTDVLQLLNLTTAKAALADAGYLTRPFDRDRTGVVLGITGANALTTPLTARLQYPVWRKVLESRGLNDEQIEDIVETIKKAYAPWEENSFPGMLGNVVAGRVANRLDLGGINCTLDAACASSLAAMRMAIDELSSGRADMMLTGGCDAENTILMFMCFSKTPAFSRKGSITPFDAEADGTLIGEGMGMMALKRLEDAERDGDRIYAVIKGLGASSDGRFKSIYAPRAEGQVKALKRAYEDAGFAPSEIGLLEAHGTGTAVGDATEAQGLKLLMQETGGLEPGDRIAFGSVKSQIGHTKAAAGAASAIKVALALHHKVLPPTINVKEPDSRLGLDEGPFYLNTQARPWFVANGSAKRRAGVSSFGFGGTNFHLVLEEAPATAAAAPRFDATPRPVVVAADTPEALLARCRQLAEAEGPEAWPFDASAPAAHARLGFAAQDDEERRSLLTAAVGMLESSPQAESWRHPKGIAYRRRAIEGAKVAALFAGQGAQHPDMGLTAMNAFPEMRTFVERVDPLFADAGDAPLSSVMYPAPAFDDAKRAGQADALRRTRYAQTAIGALAAGQFRLFERAGLRIDMAGGHSFGELAALWAAGALDDATFTSLAKARGDAMTPPADPAFDPGTMAAVVGSADAVQALIDRSGITGLQICNFNTPQQQVVGGGTREIEAFEALLGREGVKYSRLKVSGAFHTARLDHAVGRFAAAVDGATVGAPALPVYANRDGAPYAARPEAVRTQLKAQLREPVRFADLIEAMWRDGARVFVEFGPRDALSKMVGAILGDRPHVVVPLDKGSPAQAVRRMMEATAELTVAGVQLADPDHQRAPVAVPEPPKKGIVKLNGMNYVSDARRKSFADALEAGEAIVVRHREQAAPPLEAAPTPAVEAPAVPQAAFAAAGPAPEAGRPVAMAAPAVGVLSEAALLERSETLADGMTIRLPSPGSAAPAAAGTADPEAAGPEPTADAGNGTPVGANGRTAAMFGELARSHAELHGEYLSFQQNVLREVAAALDDGQSDLLVQVRRSFYQASEAHRAFMDGVVEFGRLLVGESEPLGTGVTAAPPSEPAAASPVSPAPVTTAPEPVPAAVPAVPDAALDAAKAALLEIVAEKTGYPSDVLDLDMDMEADLGIDSIKRVEILGALRERHPDMGEPDAETLAELRTLRQVLSLAGGAAPATPAQAVQPTPVAVAAPEVPAAVADAPAPMVPDTALDAAKAALLEIVAEKTGYPSDVLDLDMDMEADLGIDSIKRVEILGALRERHPDMGEPDAETLAELRTLRQVLNLAGGAVPAAPAMNGTAAPAVAPAPPVAPAPSPVPTAEVAAPAAPDAVPDAAKAALLEIVAEKTGYPSDVLDLDMDMEADLGIDSIKRVEILGALRERHPDMGEPDAETLAELRTLRQVLNLAGGAVPAAPAMNGTAAPAVAPAPGPVPTAEVAAPTVPDAALDAAKAALLEIVAEKTGYPSDVLDLDMDMEADLGIDSIKRVEILGALRERHPDMGEPDAETLAELRTLRQVLSLAGGAVPAVTETAAPAPADAPVPAPVAEVAVPAAVADGPAPTVPDAALDAAKAALLEIVAEKTGYPSDVLDLDMDMEADLGIDSIKRVEILGALRERHPDMGEPDAETLAELRTLRQVLSLAGGAAPAAPAQAVQPAPAQPAPVPPAGMPAAAEPQAEHQPVVDGVGRAEVRLAELPAASLLRDGFRKGARILIAGDDRNLAVELAGRLRADGLVPVLFGATAPGFEARMPAGADEAALAEAIADGGPWDGLVYLHPAAAGSSLPREAGAPMMARLKQALAFAKHLKQPLAEAGRQGRTAFVAVTRIDGALGYEAPKMEEIAAAGLSGLVKTFAVEAEGVFSRYVDLEPALAADAAAELLWAEMRDADGTLVEVGCNGSRRVTLALSQTLAAPAAREPEAGAEDDELFIVTGGARGVTSLCVREMARRAPRRFLLLGRSPVADADPAWAAGTEGDAALKAAAATHLKATQGKALPRDIAAAVRDVVAAREIRTLLADLKAGGSQAVYVAADIADPAALATLAMRPEITRAKRLSLIHGAGALADALIERKALGDLDRVYSPKVFGLAYLMKALPEHKLGRLWLFSSVAGLFGNVGQVDYAMANETLNRVAALWMRRGGKDARSINWGAWDAGMVTPEIRAIFAERGVTLIPPQVGAAFFADELKRPAPSSGVVMIGGLEPLSRRVALLGALESAGSLSIIADWSGILGSQAVADHKIGGRPVLPAAFALATAMAAVERLLPGWRAVSCRSFRVLSGIVVDETLSPRFVLTVRHAGRIGETDVLVDIGVEDKQGRPRFRIEGLQLSSVAAPTAPQHPANGADPNLDAGGFYRDGTLFHGMALRLLKAYSSDADQARATFLAEEPEQPVVAGAAQFSAAMGDVLLQAALAATRLRTQMPSLPMRLDNLSFDGPPVPGSRYRVEAAVVTEGASETVWRITAVADGGLRLTQVDAAVIRSAALAERFALSAE